MNDLRKIKPKHIVAVLITIISFAVLDVYVTLKRAEEQYQKFIYEERKSSSSFDELNYLVYKNMPIPDGVEEINLDNKSSHMHGRSLMAEYVVSNRKIEDVFAEYNQFLVINGWKQIEAIDDNKSMKYSYDKGTACIDFYSFKDSGEYKVDIYHDFFKQDFSPQLMPPLNKRIVLLMEFGETHFVECPQK